MQTEKSVNNRETDETYQWWPLSHKTWNLISAYTVSLPRVSALRGLAAVPSARHQSCEDVHRQTRATPVCGTGQPTDSLDGHTGSELVWNTQQHQNKRSCQSRRTCAARERQQRGRAGPGSSESWRSLARDILTAYTATYDDDRLSIQNSPHWTRTSVTAHGPAARSGTANKCNQRCMDGGHRRHNNLKVLRKVVRQTHNIGSHMNQAEKNFTGKTSIFNLNQYR